jgi:AraC-like DNA-binding protein
MNNKISNIFLFRRKKGKSLESASENSVENFHINQKRSPLSEPNVLHCFAYGECFWDSRHEQHSSYSKEWQREWWSFEYITEGNGVFISDNIRYNIRPGDIYILKPWKKIFLRPEKGSALRKRCVLLEGHLLDFICENGRLEGIDFIRPGDPKRLEMIYDNFKQLILRQDEFLEEELSQQGYALLAELNRLAKPLEYPLALHKAITLINTKPHSDLMLGSLCTECNVSISTLTRLFRRYLKTSPMNYIIDRRLEQAKLFIQIGNMTLKEIAEKCGYNSESFLSRSFKKKFGVPPASLRRSKLTQPLPANKKTSKSRQ